MHTDWRIFLWTQFRKKKAHNLYVFVKTLEDFLRKSMFRCICKTWIALCHISSQHWQPKVFAKYSRRAYCTVSFLNFLIIRFDFQLTSQYYIVFIISIIMNIIPISSLSTLTCWGLLIFGVPVFCWLNKITAYSEIEDQNQEGFWVVSKKEFFRVSWVSRECFWGTYQGVTSPTHQQGLRKQRVYRRASKLQLLLVLRPLECWWSPLQYNWWYQAGDDGGWP